jgi:hypothetical protein
MHKLLIVTVTALLYGCATPYQKQGFAGGYSEAQLNTNVFRVSFKGNGYTSREKAADLALLRSADLALQNGYRYFVIIDKNNYSQNSLYKTPTTSYTNVNVYGAGNFAYGQATTNTYGGNIYNISKPSATNTIICFPERPPNIFSYDAEFIYNSLATKYKVKPETK